MLVTASGLAVLATSAGLLTYKWIKSAYLEDKEKQKPLPRFTSGRVEKFYKGKSKRQRPRIKRNKEKISKKKIETILEGDQVTLVTNLKQNVNKIDVQEKVQNEEIVEEDMINSMVMTNFSGCSGDCHCNQDDQQETVQNEYKEDVNKVDVEKVQNEEIMEEDMINSMVMTNFSGCLYDCHCDQDYHKEPVQNECKKNTNKSDVQEKVENEEILEEDLIKSMVTTNFSGCNNCNCSHPDAHTAGSTLKNDVNEIDVQKPVPNDESMEEAFAYAAESGLTSSEDFSKFAEEAAKQPEAMLYEDEGDLETSNHYYTAIKSKETSDSNDVSHSIFEESINGNKKAGPDSEMYQNSTPITFPSLKRDLIPKMQLSKIKIRKRPGAIEIPFESPKPSSVTNSGCENQISKEVERANVPIDQNMEFETDSNTISKEAALETFEVQNYEHPLGAWTPTDGSVIPPWKKDLLPPEPLPPTPYGHNTPTPDVSLLKYIDKFDQEEHNPTAIEEIIENENLSIMQNLPAAKSDLDSSVLNTDENMNENSTHFHEKKPLQEDGDYDTSVGSNSVDAATENETCKSTLFGGSQRLLKKIDTNGNESHDHNDQFCHQGHDIQLNNEGDGGLLNDQRNDDLLNDQGNDVQVNDQRKDGHLSHQRYERLNDQVNDGQFSQGNDGQFNHQGNDRQLNDKGNYVQLNDQGNNGQLNVQGHSRASNMGPVVTSEASLNDIEDFADNEFSIVAIKGDPTFISATLHRLVKKENQEVELIPNKSVAPKSHIQKAQGNQNTLDSQMSGKKISDKDSSGGPCLIHSTLPWYSHTPVVPVSKTRKLRNHKK